MEQTNNGVFVRPSIEQQGELARMCYTVTNTNSRDVVVSLGTHADVMIGNNDRAPILRRIDTVGQTYGLTMKDGNGAQLCVLFGAGLAGVTAVNDFWFGYYSQNNSPSQMVGSYSSGSNWMVENGSYDSGMGWCWKNRTIPAGTTVVFSYLIGVGEVNLEPNSSFEVTPDDPEGWNDLNRPHRLTLDGTYESPAGLDGTIDYAVEDSEEWTALTDVLSSGDTFSASLVATFNPSLSVHTIRFRTRDLVGNTTMLQPIEYKDVSFYLISGIEDKIYTGDSIYQENLACELEVDQYAAKNYSNNVNVGVASFSVEGVFPMTIGRKSYTFNIMPQPLSGELVLAQTEFIYNGSSFTPDWQFSNGSYSSMKAGEDYTAVWTNNKLPGTGTLTVAGKNNYTSTLTANIHIDKAPLTDNLFTLTLPDEDITYDGQSHGASVTKQSGVGTVSISYQKEGESDATTAKPKNAGNYIIYLEIADGTLYYGRVRAAVGTFSIYQFSEEEWNTLQSLLPQLTAMGWSQPWDLSQGVKGVAFLQGLSIEKGHVAEFNLAGQNLTGQIPNGIFDLLKLQTLNLSHNELTGDIAQVFEQLTAAGKTNSVETLDLSYNQLSGNIGSVGQVCTGLRRLDASHNRFEECSPKLSGDISAVDLSFQKLDWTWDFILNDAQDNMQLLPSILRYDHQKADGLATRQKFICALDDWSMSVSYADGLLTVTAPSGQVYTKENGVQMDATLTTSAATGSSFKMQFNFMDGDGNFDGQVNVLDLQSSLNYMFNDYHNKPFNFTASNLYRDEVINVQDIVLMVDKLLSAVGSNNKRRNAFVREEEVLDVADASLYWRGNELILNTSTGVAAADICLTGDASITWSLQQMGFIVTEKKDAKVTHAVIYSLSDAEIPVGETVIAHRDGGSVEPVSAMLSDRQAAPVSVSLTVSEATAISKLIVVNGDWSIFRTDGTIVAHGTGSEQLASVRKHLATGVYILQGENNNIQKFTIK